MEADSNMMIQRGVGEAVVAVAVVCSYTRIAEAASRRNEVGDHFEDHEVS